MKSQKFILERRDNPVTGGCLEIRRYSDGKKTWLNVSPNDSALVKEFLAAIRAKKVTVKS